MKFSSTVVATLAALAPASARVMRRDFGTIINDGLLIFNDLAAVQTALNAFGPNNSTGTLAQALAVSNATTVLSNDLGKAATDAASSDPLDDGESTAVASAISQLATPIYNTLDLLVTKHPQFNAVQGFLPAGSLVENQLAQLKNSTDAYGAAIIPKLSPVFAKLAPLVLSDFDYHLIRAIQAYNGTFGL